MPRHSVSTTCAQACSWPAADSPSSHTQEAFPRYRTRAHPRTTLNLQIRGTCASDSQMQGVKPGGSLSRTHSRALRRTDLERVSIGLLESFEADEGGGQREEGCEGVGAAFVAQRQAAVAGEIGRAHV